MLAPAMRAKLIAELEYQHENAATPANMVREDPLNYEAYATVCNLFFCFRLCYSFDQYLFNVRFPLHYMDVPTAL